MKTSLDANAGLPAAIDSGTILRESLIRKMRSLSAKKNIFITEAGGYGKTVAAGQ